MDPDRLLTSQETAALMQISLTKLEHDRCTGKGPRYAKLGGAVRYRKRDVLDITSLRIFETRSIGGEGARVSSH